MLFLGTDYAVKTSVKKSQKSLQALLDPRNKILTIIKAESSRTPEELLNARKIRDDAQESHT